MCAKRTVQRRDLQNRQILMEPRRCASPRAKRVRSSAASDVYTRQVQYDRPIRHHRYHVRSIRNYTPLATHTTRPQSHNGERESAASDGLKSKAGRLPGVHRRPPHGLLEDARRQRVLLGNRGRVSGGRLRHVFRDAPPERGVAGPRESRRH